MATDAQKQIAKLKREQVREGQEHLLRIQLEEAGLPLPQAEYRFHPTRGWRIDFAWPSIKLALEVEGSFYGTGPKCPVCKQRKGGGHTSISGLEKDLEKYNELTRYGWGLIRVTPEMLELRNGKAIAILKQVLY